MTTTSADLVGMATETDAGVWSLTNSGSSHYIFTYNAGGVGSVLEMYNTDIAQLLAAGGNFVPYTAPGPLVTNVAQVSIPESLLNQPIASHPGSVTWATVLLEFQSDPAYDETIANGGLHTGILNPWEVRYTTAYDAGIVAQAGHTVLQKSMNINTGNKVLTQSNLKVQTGLTYVATGDGGNVVGSENLLLDGAGNTTSASDRMLCPFTSQPIDVIPAYCNIVQTGNAYDLTIGSVTSVMGERFISSDATNPAELDHEFAVKPYGTTEGSIPAMGSTSTYLKAHIQEARSWNNVTHTVPIPNDDGGTFSYTIPGTPLKAEDLQYSDYSSASGVIHQFTKVIQYQSGKSLMP